MMENELLAPTPWWFVVVSAFGIIAYLIHWKSDISKSVKTLEAATPDIKASFQKVIERLTDLGDRLSTIEGRLAPKVSISQSPVQLTDFGHKISTAAEAAEWAEEHAPKLAKAASGKEEFEVFNMCAEHVKKQYAAKDGNIRGRIEASAYEHGVEIEQVQRVFTIELRDKVLKIAEKN